MRNVLEQFELMAKKYPNKTLYADEKDSISFADFKNRCQSVATEILKFDVFNSPIAVIDNRNVNTFIGMFSVLYSSNHYVVLDGSSPKDRLFKILDVIKPKILICQDSTLSLANELNQGGNFKLINVDKVDCSIDEPKLLEARGRLISTDPAYILFTSGSTGVPKGTVVTHRNLIDYISWFAGTFKIGSKTIFAGQTPSYFSASVSDIYSSLMFGATYNIVPKKYFSFPILLVRYLNERKVNTIYWVPSALCIVANVNLFAYDKPKFLKKVMFAGEIMPNKQLNYWRKHLPRVKYANLFGPTETVDICTYYIVNRKFNDYDSLPIGRHCENLDTFLLDENNQLITKPGKVGELYVRGGFVTAGYYGNDEQTKKAFVQNPLNHSYPEIVYKTGDLVSINKFGEYEYVGRSDYQIKHKGYRIELGEIERVVGALQNVDAVACVYDKEADLLVLLYSGKLREQQLYDEAKNKLPDYMVPEKIIRQASLPLNQNGKIDRKFLLNNYKNL